MVPIKSFKTGMIILAILLIVSSLNIVFGQKNKQQMNFSLDMQALNRNKDAVLAKDPDALQAYKQLLKDADKALAFGPVSVMEKDKIPPSGNKHDYMSIAPYHWPDPTKPDGLPYIRKDGQTNPEVLDYKDKDYMPDLCDKVFKLSLAYFFSEEPKYAEHAAKLLQVWFLDTATKMNPNLNYAQAIKGVNEGRGAGMIDARHFIKIIESVGLLNSNKKWTTEHQQGMVSWFTTFLDWMQTSKNGRDEMKAPNNHGIWYDALRLNIALFIGNETLATEIVRNAEIRLDKQMDDNGRLPLEMARTTSLHYSVFAMDAFFNVALMAEKLKIDFWQYTSPSGKSLKKAFDELLPYIANQKEWDGEQIKPYKYEESYMMLKNGGRKLKCGKCEAYIKQLADEKYPRLYLNLLY